jgi:hypothetical protein
VGATAAGTLRLIESTTRAAALAAAGRLAVAGAVSAGAVRLGENALRSMLMVKLKGLAVVVLLVAGLVVTGGGLRAYQAKGDRPKGEGEAGRAGDAVQKAESKGTIIPDAPRTPEEQYRRMQREQSEKGAASGGGTAQAQGGPSPKGNTPADRRLAAALRLFRSQEAFYDQGMITIDRLIEASRRVLDSQQDLCEAPADRVAAARAHRDRVAAILASTRRRLEGGIVPRPDLDEAEYALADAEVLLARAEAAAGGEKPGAAGGAMAVMMGGGGGGGAGMEGGAAPLEYQGDKDPRSRAILALLDEPITMTFEETPLKDVIKHIRGMSVNAHNRRPINIYVDPSAVDGNGHLIGLDTPVTIDLEGVPLRRTLQLVLLPLNLSYGVVGRHPGDLEPGEHHEPPDARPLRRPLAGPARDAAADAQRRLPRRCVGRLARRDGRPGRRHALIPDRVDRSLFVGSAIADRLPATLRRWSAIADPTTSVPRRRRIGGDGLEDISVSSPDSAAPPERDLESCCWRIVGE